MTGARPRKGGDARNARPGQGLFGPALLPGAKGLAVALVALAACATKTPPCNPFYPTPRDASWTYLDAQQNAQTRLLRTVAVRSTETAGGVTTAILQQSVAAPEHPDRPVGAGTTTVRCAGGAVQLEIHGTASPGGGAVTGGTVNALLPGLPPPEKLVPGYAWQSEGRVEASEGSSTLVTSVARSNRVEGLFPLRVGAGDFPEAVQIVSVETLRLATPSGERHAEQQVREWYVRGIGLVKRDTRIAGAGQGSASTEELVGYSGLEARP